MLQSKNKLAVIGGTGFIGKEFAAYAQQSGFAIDVVPREAVDLVARFNDCEGVVILAALTPKKGLTALENNMRFMDNLRIVENIYSAISQSTVEKILYVSTDAVYDSAQSLYGLAHKVRERLLLEIGKNKKICILRPCAIYGAADPHNGYGPNRFLREAITNKTITLFGNGEELRKHIYVKDFVSIMLQMIINSTSGIYNVAPNESVSFMNLAELIAQILPFDVTIKHAARTAPIKNILHKTTKLHRIIPYVEFRSLASGIDLMYKDLILGTEITKERLHAGS